MKFQFVFLTSILFLSACSSQQTTGQTQKSASSAIQSSVSVNGKPETASSSTDLLLSQEMTGVWQTSPGMAAGWSTRYQFFSSGKYNYRASQMAPALRDRGNSGFWEARNGILTVILMEQYSIVGGTEEKDVLHGTIIKGGTLETSKPLPTPHELYVLQCSHPEVAYYDCRTIDGVDFYKFSPDPTYGHSSDLEPEPIF